MSNFLKPPDWTAAELQLDAQLATSAFIQERMDEPSKKYEELYLSERERLCSLFDQTIDLVDVKPQLIMGDKSWINELRYLSGPPISADDLKTIVGDKLNKRILAVDVAERVIETVYATLDPYRIGWVQNNSSPSDSERQTAIDWTAGLMAVERLKTMRRTSASAGQEDSVKELVANKQFKHVPRPSHEVRTIDCLDRGTYTDETKLAGAKADILVRLMDGRLLAIECKVSNSAVNSIKRLVREAGGKAATWRAAFGLQVVPCAVIGGVYDVSTLVRAQDQGIFIVWQHDLNTLSTFVEAAV